MLSPLELENKRILTNKRKYDKLEMDEYLDMVFENYKVLYNENEELKKQIKTLSEGIQYYRSIESTMQKALVLAEKTSKETKDAAALKAEAIEKEANNRATQIVSTAEAEYTRIREKCLALVQQFNQYKAQLQVAANEQLRLITSATFEVETPEIENQGEPPLADTGMQAVAPAVPEPQTEMDVQPLPESQPIYEQPFTEAMPEIESPVSEQPSSMQTMPQDNAEEKAKSSVYTFSGSGNTQPLPDLSQLGVVPEADPGMQIPVPEAEPAVKEEALTSQPAPQMTPQTTPQTTPQETPQASQPTPQAPVTASPDQEFEFEAVPSDKTMILPDVKSVDRESIRSKKAPLTDAETMSILNAETINLGDSIREVREKEGEPLQVPPAQEVPPVLQMEPEPTPSHGQAQGLDSILQNITIGKKKKNGSSGTQEDPFEFLGSVDDF